MGWWTRLLDSLDSNGGHIFVLLALLVGAFIVMHLDAANMKAGEIVTGAFAALLAMLRSAGSNREQQGGSTTVARVETVVKPEEPQQ